VTGHHRAECKGEKEHDSEPTREAALSKGLWITQVKACKRRHADLAQWRNGKPQKGQVSYWPCSATCKAFTQMKLGVKCHPVDTENGHSERGNPFKLSLGVRQASRLTSHKREGRRMTQGAKAMLQWHG
jgi:hypothetical protein